MSKSWNNNGGRSFNKGSSRNNKSYKKKSNRFVHRPYKIYPQLDDGTFYIYHYDIGFGATFESISDIKKWLDGYDY